MPLGKLGKYDRVDVLGHGASGIVYLAWDTLLKRQVALKEIDVQAGDMGRFLEEARVLDRLNHPNIVRVNGVDVIAGHVVIDMEYVKGRNLQQLLREHGRMPWDRAVDIAVRVLDALDYAHVNHTVHRDIKPANILISRAGDVKLVDFGLAEILGTNSYAGGAGTYAYMAPEDFANERHSDHQSDIWAVGITLYEMLTSLRPFEVANVRDPLAWRRALLTQEPKPLMPVRAPSTDASTDGDGGSAEVTPPRGLQQCLDRALAREKDARYQTAGDFRDDLRAVAAGTVPAVVPAPAGAAARRVEPPTPPSLPRAQGVTPVAAPDVVPRRADARGAGALAPAWSVPPGIDFGEVRQGDERSRSVTVRFARDAARPGAAVAAAPGWLQVTPSTFVGRRQRLRLTAITDRVWQPGHYTESVRLQTSSGELHLPVDIRVLKARRSFGEVAYWFVPLLVAVLLPALTLSVGSHVSREAARHLAPAAVVGCWALAAMLLSVSIEGDLGINERVAAGGLLAVLTGLLGAVTAQAFRTGGFATLASVPATALTCGPLLVLLGFTSRHWRLWGWGIGLLSLIMSGVFASTLSRWV